MAHHDATTRRFTCYRRFVTVLPCPCLSFLGAGSASWHAGSRGGCSCRCILMADGMFQVLQQSVSLSLAYAWARLALAWRTLCTLCLSCPWAAFLLQSKVAVYAFFTGPDCGSGLDLASAAGWCSLNRCWTAWFFVLSCLLAFCTYASGWFSLQWLLSLQYHSVAHYLAECMH